MSKLKSAFLYVLHLQYVKYLVVVAIGVLIVGFVGDNCVYAHMKNKQRISELQEEIDFHMGNFQRDQARIRELEANPKAMERIARERYFMKSKDEDIFVLSDDND
jgi:cell division protein FtsB